MDLLEIAKFFWSLSLYLPLIPSTVTVAFPTETLRNDSYEVGDIIYWPTAGSFVILYRQNGEQFSRQHLGHIESGVEVFETTGNTDVTFESMN